jgi:LDH2 family malate/lactate/ureidoglycolate dehydrogenase
VVSTKGFLVLFLLLTALLDLDSFEVCGVHWLNKWVDLGDAGDVSSDNFVSGQRKSESGVAVDAIAAVGMNGCCVATHLASGKVRAGWPWMPSPLLE